ncbi:MAG: tRNA-intron lyase [Methanobacteriota archaeon]|nr:MAG: tRNA-intron lyase [Euryarchaeota archaeon]
MDGELIEDKVIVRDGPGATRLAQRGFGTLKEGALELSLLEALFLMERGTLKVHVKGEEAGKDILIKRSEGEEDFLLRYSVYSDLRKRGYVVKTGFKFGVHFRVYERGEFSSEGHSAILVHVVPEDSTMTFPDISRAVRLAKSVKKRMIFAVVDHEGDITYYQIDRVVP